MAYCSLADVQALSPKWTYNETSQPTSTQVEALITQIAAEIDVALAFNGQTVPVTEPASFVSGLRYINAYGAAALAEHGMFPDSSEKGSTPHWKALWETYREWLKELKTGKLPATLQPSQVGSYYTDVADQDEFPDPVFRKSSNDMEF